MTESHLQNLTHMVATIGYRHAFVESHWCVNSDDNDTSRTQKGSTAQKRVIATRKTLISCRGRLRHKLSIHGKTCSSESPCSYELKREMTPDHQSPCRTSLASRPCAADPAGSKSFNENVVIPELCKVHGRDDPKKLLLSLCKNPFVRKFMLLWLRWLHTGC